MQPTGVSVMGKWGGGGGFPLHALDRNLLILLTWKNSTTKGSIILFMLLHNKNFIFSCIHCFCTIFILPSYPEKGSNGQIHSSGSHHLIKKPPPARFSIFPAGRIPPPVMLFEKPWPVIWFFKNCYPSVPPDIFGPFPSRQPHQLDINCCVLMISTQRSPGAWKQNWIPKSGGVPICAVNFSNNVRRSRSTWKLNMKQPLKPLHNY